MFASTEYINSNNLYETYAIEQIGGLMVRINGFFNQVLLDSRTPSPTLKIVCDERDLLKADQEFFCPINIVIKQGNTVLYLTTIQDIGDLDKLEKKKMEITQKIMETYYKDRYLSSRFSVITARQ